MDIYFSNLHNSSEYVFSTIPGTENTDYGQILEVVPTTSIHILPERNESYCSSTKKTEI